MSVTIDQLIAHNVAEAAPLLAQFNSLADQLGVQREREQNGEAVDVAHVSDMRERKAALGAKLDALDARKAMLLAEKAEDDRVARMQEERPAKQSSRAAGESFDVNPVTGRHTVSSTDREEAQKFIVRDRPGQQAAVRADQRFIDHPVVAELRAQRRAGEDAATAMFGGLGEMVRSLTTSGTSAVVPTVWASEIIDIARANAAVIKAGAQIMPMDALTVQIGRLTADPISAFRTEGSAITASDPTFDNVTLTAKTMNCLVIGSMEWFADAQNADQLLMNAIGKSIALQLDKVALYGGITTGAGTISLATPPNPRGILATLNAVKPANVLGGLVNGTVPTNYNEIVDLDFQVENANENPTGMILPSRLAQKYAKFYDTMNQPLRKPDAVLDFEWFTSNQIPTYTQGTATTATDVFLGDFTELIIGQRLDMQIQVLTERYADLGQIGIVATWRGDIAPARPGAFAVYKCIVGS